MKIFKKKRDPNYEADVAKRMLLMLENMNIKIHFDETANYSVFRFRATDGRYLRTIIIENEQDYVWTTS